MQSKASTVAEYLASLPEDRREAIRAVREVILKHLDRDYEEGMAYGMIGYAVPLRIFPRGYHCAPPSKPQPLPFVCLASQKNHMSLHFMSLYGDESHWDRFRKEWARTGKKLDMGKGCIRFKKLDDLALEVIAREIRETPARAYLASYQKALAAIQAGRPGKKAPAGTAARPAAKAVAGSGARPVAKKAVKKAAKRKTARG